MPIRRRITHRQGNMRLETRMYLFLFDFMWKRVTWLTVSTNGGPPMLGPRQSGVHVHMFFDEDEEFVTGFQRAFYAHLLPIEGEKTTMARMRKLLNQAAADNQIRKHRDSNQKEYIGEPTWLMGYTLYPEDCWKLREGKYNPEFMARRYCGDGDPQAALG